MFELPSLSSLPSLAGSLLPKTGMLQTFKDQARGLVKLPTLPSLPSLGLPKLAQSQPSVSQATIGVRG
jgi:hypothetical protein